MHTTRFAPSPTGLLHLGHAFAAFTAHEAAQGGRFLVRLEDLDRTRARPEFEAAILEDLAWLGLSWEQPVLRQSSRGEAYRLAIAQLAARELVYPCYCSRKEIAEEAARAGEAPHRSGEILYPGTCRALSARERAVRTARGDSCALRLDAGKASMAVGELTFTESGVGPAGERDVIAVQPLLFGDIVLARKDLPAAYHLAVVVDDAYQGVTLVTRGNDLFASTHVQRLLQALLGLAPPRYAHHALILDARGRKYSKRDRSVTLRSLREQGLRPSDVRGRFP